jgi:hypothetical protein
MTNPSDQFFDADSRTQGASAEDKTNDLSSDEAEKLRNSITKQAASRTAFIDLKRNDLMNLKPGIIAQYIKANNEPIKVPIVMERIRNTLKLTFETNEGRNLAVKDGLVVNNILINVELPRETSFDPNFKVTVLDIYNIPTEIPEADIVLMLH